MGAARRRSRGHGPARLDGTRPRATVASKVMDSGKMAGQATARSSRRPHASESAQRRRREGRSGAAGSVVSKGRQAQRGGDGLQADPPEASAARRTGSRSRAEGVSRALRGNDGGPKGRDAKGGSMRKHDSAVGQIWPETPGKYLGAMYLK